MIFEEEISIEECLNRVKKRIASVKRDADLLCRVVSLSDVTITSFDVVESINPKHRAAVELDELINVDILLKDNLKEYSKKWEDANDVLVYQHGKMVEEIKELTRLLKEKYAIREYKEPTLADF